MNNNNIMIEHKKEDKHTQTKDNNDVKIKKTICKRTYMREYMREYNLRKYGKKTKMSKEQKKENLKKSHKKYYIKNRNTILTTQKKKVRINRINILKEQLNELENANQILN